MSKQSKRVDSKNRKSQMSSKEDDVPPITDGGATP